MEHEFYTGLSLGAMALYAIKKMRPSVGSLARQGSRGIAFIQLILHDIPSALLM